MSRASENKTDSNAIGRPAIAQSPPTRPLFYCFIHIPKTGGKTFLSVLQQCFRSQLTVLDHRVMPAPLTKTDVQRILENQPQLKCIAGHHVRADLPYDFADRDVRALCFIREPFERLVSDYYYSRKLGLRGLIQRCETLEAFVHELGGGGSYFVNPQARFVHFDGSGFDDKLTREKLLLLPMKYFDEACVLLKLMFPDDFKDVSYSRRNVNTSKPSVSGCDRLQELARQSVLQLDYEVYERALLQFERLQAAYLNEVDFDKLLIAHWRRCRVRGYLLKPFEVWAERIGKLPRYLRLP